jgi:hypothetical protein
LGAARKGDFRWLFLVYPTGVDRSGGESDRLREVGPDGRRLDGGAIAARLARFTGHTCATISPGGAYGHQAAAAASAGRRAPAGDGRRSGLEVRNRDSSDFLWGTVQS